MRAAYVPAKRTPLTFEQAEDAILLALSSVLGEIPSVQTRALALAKTALETGRWQAIWNFNFGNCKASDKWEGL